MIVLEEAGMCKDESQTVDEFVKEYEKSDELTVNEQNGNEYVWFLELCESGKEVIYNRTQDRFATDKEIESLHD